MIHDHTMSYINCVIVQIAMAVQTSNSQDLLQANIFGQSVEMYIYSHLGLGLMAGRGKMLGAGLDDNSPKLHGDGVIEYDSDWLFLSLC